MAKNSLILNECIIQSSCVAAYEREKPGFEFLGFNIRQYPTGKYQSGKTTKGERLLGFKTIITPSKDKQKVHHEQVAKIIEADKSAPQAALINRLNPVIRGWANYYSTVCSKKSYAEQDHQMYQKLRAWARLRHPKKSRGWIVSKYWQTIEGDNWIFAVKGKGENPIRLLKHDKTPICYRSSLKIYDDLTRFYSFKLELFWDTIC